MKAKLLFAALFACVTLTAHAADPAVVSAAACFTPDEDCTSQIVGVLSRSKAEILVQAYSFTSAPIARALVSAKRRGGDVRVILDKSQRTERYSSADFLATSGVAVWDDSKHAITYNKIMVIDDDLVITGIFNFTKSVQFRNAENVILLKSRDIAERYIENWQHHLSHSVVYRGHVARGMR